MSRTIFSLLKVPILSNKLLCVGVQPKQTHFNKTLLRFDCKSNLRYKAKDCMTDVTVTQSIPVLHAENSVPTLLFGGRLYPKNGYQAYYLRF